MTVYRWECKLCGQGMNLAAPVTGEIEATAAKLHIAVCKGDPRSDAAPGRKDDGGKPRPDLLPPRAVLEIAKVLEFGARKYGPDNWRKVEGWRWRYTGAALRHLFAWMGGERGDPESGLHHLAHAGCCVLFLLEKEIEP